MRAIFDNHIAAALLTDHICHFIFNLHLFQFCLGFFHCCLQIRIKILDDCLPSDFSFRNAIQKALHICRKVHIHNTREGLFHNIIHYFSDFRQIQILILFCHIASCNDRRNCRRICTWTPDSKFFQCLNQCCLCIMCRWLCKMLLTVQTFFRKDRIHIQPF